MNAQILVGDAIEQLRTLPAESVQCVVTSPPYWGLRDYGADGQIGLEATFGEYLDRMVEVFAQVRRVLRGDGVAWVNMGDAYATAGGPGWQGASGQRADRRFTATRDAVALRDIGRRPPEGLKAKDLIGQPWRLAFALQADGWWLRQDVIWHKPNPMPESIRDRCTKAHEYIFLLSKSERYFYDADAVSEAASENTHARLPGNKSHKGATAYEDGSEEHRTKAGLVNHAERQRARKGAPNGSGTKNNPSFDAAMAVMPERRNRRSVWTIASEPYAEAHFATFPTELPRICILAGSKTGDTILDPFNGSGTTGQVALELGRQYVGIELNPKYVELTQRRLSRVTLGLPLEAA